MPQPALARYCGFEPEGSEMEPPPPTTEELIARHAHERLEQLEDENAQLRQQVRALTAALGCAAKVLLPYHTPRVSTRQR